jgi:hypothetical protein
MPEDTPQPDTPDLDDALAELRQRCGDLGIVSGIIVDLRRNANRLQPMLRDELVKLRNLLDEILPLLPQ